MQGRAGWLGPIFFLHCTDSGSHQDHWSPGYLTQAVQSSRSFRLPESVNHPLRPQYRAGSPEGELAVSCPDLYEEAPWYGTTSQAFSVCISILQTRTLMPLALLLQVGILLSCLVHRDNVLSPCGWAVEKVDANHKKQLYFPRCGGSHL